MTNKEIANAFQLLAGLMEVHGENKFKIRSYQSAYRNLRSLDTPLAEMEDGAIASLKGVGKAIHGKIRELLDNGVMATLERYKTQTPEGIQELLQIKGLGAKKIQNIWKELGVESVGELLYAVNENRLVELKGFGKKTQDDLKQKLEYHQQSRNKFHYASLLPIAEELISYLKQQFPDAAIHLTGEMRRKCPILSRISVILARDGDILSNFGEKIVQIRKENSIFEVRFDNYQVPVQIITCPMQEIGIWLIKSTGSTTFVETLLKPYESIDFYSYKETSIFETVGLPFFPPELREASWLDNDQFPQQLPTLIEDTDIKGVLHVHTTYSDGQHSLEDMVRYAKDLGYAYIGITDHSKSAFYANGLKPERLFEQWEAIDRLNAEMPSFKIFKGIESDILSDGRLDYEEDILRQFDFIIASVHSNLKMDEAKATQRLITAIENPYTSILGHPSGRLLLSRKGYPLDHKKVIDACAANSVAIELNANPYRLDLDWTWIPYAVERSVKIAINPDAHSKQGIHDIQYGVAVARKGGLSATACLNNLSRDNFEAYLHKGAR